MMTRERLASLAVLIAIPIFIALLVPAGQAEACVGGKPTDYLFKDTVKVDMGSYGTDSFDVKALASVDVSKEGPGTLYILNETEMGMYKAGSDFTPVIVISGNEVYGHEDLMAGRYHVVLDNVNGTSGTDTKVEIYIPGDKCGASAEGGFMPGFEMGVSLAALISAVALAFVMRRA